MSSGDTGHPGQPPASGLSSSTHGSDQTKLHPHRSNQGQLTAYRGGIILETSSAAKLRCRSGLWCESCNSRVVELKKQAVKLWMSYAVYKEGAQYQVSVAIMTLFRLIIPNRSP